MSIDQSSTNVVTELGILKADEVAELLKLRHSTVLDLSRRGILPAFKIGKHWRYRPPISSSGWAVAVTRLECAARRAAAARSAEPPA